VRIRPDCSVRIEYLEGVRTPIHCSAH
jgi:hypothetical protein